MNEDSILDSDRLLLKIHMNEAQRKTQLILGDLFNRNKKYICKIRKYICKKPGFILYKNYKLFSIV